LAIPTVVFLELGWALKRGRIQGPPNIREWRKRILSLGVHEVGLTSEVAMLASELDELHGDPMDRIMIATALVEDAVLLTADQPILNWPGKLRRQDARR
jgi:PIN domain nuclease of toxin-antitoxin system